MAKRKAEGIADKSCTAGSGTEKLFNKKQLIVSKRFRDKKDLLNALLQENKLYAVSEAEEMIEIYLKGTVK